MTFSRAPFKRFKTFSHIAALNIYSNFQGCLSMQLKAIQISKKKIYFVENGLFNETRLHAYSNKKNLCGKKRMQKNATLAQVWSSDSFRLQAIARNSF